MQMNKPLTLTLSPSDGEREQQDVPRDGFFGTCFAIRLSNDVRFAGSLPTILPRPFRRGEGRGEGKLVFVTSRRYSCLLAF